MLVTHKTKPPQNAGVVVCYVKPRFHYIVSRLRLLAYAGVSVQTPVSTAQEIVPVPGDLGVGA